MSITNFIAVAQWPERPYFPVATGTLSPFQAWLGGLVASRYGSVKALAERIGRTDSALARMAEGGTAGVETLLRLAKETGESPSKVFQIAGKAEVDALIRQLYGAATPSLSSDVQSVVNFLALDDEDVERLQELTVEAAKRALAQSRESNRARGAGDRAGATDRRATRGARKQKAKRGDDQP